MIESTFKTQSLDQKIDAIIFEEKLRKDQNSFFSQVQNILAITPNPAINIAFNWREITKTFLLTSIKGLAVLAEEIQNNPQQSEDYLAGLQTIFSVISDDLNNVHPKFKEVAPHGIDGIHYQWWEKNILAKLTPHVALPAAVSLNIQALLSTMEEFSKHPIGIAVQLRVVESIAFDIASAFLQVFNKVKINGKLLYRPVDLIWITAHIQAETAHNEQVCNDTAGMARILKTVKESDVMDMVRDYCRAWYLALDDFAIFLR